MGTVDWRDVADIYDENQGDKGDFWHRTVLDPPLFTLVGDVSGLRVLDLACGNGHNTRRLARLGAQVTGVDASEGIIEWCQSRERREPLSITYHHADAARLDMLDDASFDLVVCQMALMDMPDAASALREAARVLRPGSRFVALFLHPCFFVPEASAWVVETMGPERTVWRKVRRYAEPFKGRVHWRGPNREIFYTASYHRPLSWYVRALRSAGLVLTSLEEPQPGAEFIAQREDGAWMADVPLHCLIEARKLAL